MTAPTQPVTVRLADFGGPAVAGVKVTAKMSAVDYTAAGIFVSNEPVTGTTDVDGIAVLNCFPNAAAPTGLGTRGTTVRFSAPIPGSRPLNVEAAVPNTPCSLTDILVDDEDAPPAPVLRDATDGWPGLTGYAINLKNAAGTIKSFLVSAATAARTWTFPDKDGTVAMTSDLTKANVGLGNVDDTADANKPVSTAQAAADATVLSTAQGDALVAAIIFGA